MLLPEADTSFNLASSSGSAPARERSRCKGRSDIRRAQWDDLWAWLLADGFAALGEADEAFRWWNRAVELGICAPAFLAHYDRFLVPLRGEPDFGRLLARARMASDAFRAAIAHEPPLELPA